MNFHPEDYGAIRDGVGTIALVILGLIQKPPSDHP